MIDIKKLINFQKKNDILRKSIYVFIIISIFVICIGSVNIEFFPFILILPVTSTILYLYAKKINIKINKMYNEIVKNE